jgi:hypothetical protein
VKERGSWGGRREGAGAKPITDQERHDRQLRAQGVEAAASGDPVETLAALIGLSPRVAALRPDLAAKYELVEPMEHFDAFLRTFCRYTQLGEVAEGGPKLGDPFTLEQHEREFFGEALSCEDGRRVYKRAGLIIPRKNRKTTIVAGLSLYLGSPADGEHRPLMVQAAGVEGPGREALRDDEGVHRRPEVRVARFAAALPAGADGDQVPVDRRDDQAGRRRRRQQPFARSARCRGGRAAYVEDAEAAGELEGVDDGWGGRPIRSRCS